MGFLGETNLSVGVERFLVSLISILNSVMSECCFLVQLLRAIFEQTYNINKHIYKKPRRFCILENSKVTGKVWHLLVQTADVEYYMGYLHFFNLHLSKMCGCSNSLSTVLSQHKLSHTVRQLENPSDFYELQYNDNLLPATGPAEVFYCLC